MLVADHVPESSSAPATALASWAPSAFVSVSYPTVTGVPLSAKVVRHPAGCDWEKNCCGTRDTGAGSTSGVSTLPTEPAISMATPPKVFSSWARKKCAQSELIQRLCTGSGLNPRDSVCWLTSPSVAMTVPLSATACIDGISWSSTNGYDDQH